MENSNSNSSQETPKSHQVSNRGDAESQNNEIEDRILSTHPVAEPSASNGCEPPLCKYFKWGYCRNGELCRFQHAGSQTLDSSAANGASSDQVCKFYRLGRCRNGKSCRFRHNYDGKGELCPSQLAMILKRRRRARYVKRLLDEALLDSLEQRLLKWGFKDEENLELPLPRGEAPGQGQL